MKSNNNDVVPDLLNEVPTAFMGLTQAEMISLGAKCIGISCSTMGFIGILIGNTVVISLLLGVGVVLGALSLVGIAKMTASSKAGTPYGYKAQKAKVYGVLARLGLRKTKGIHQTRLWSHKKTKY